MSFWERLGEVADDFRDWRGGVAYDIARTFTDEQDAKKVSAFFKESHLDEVGDAAFTALDWGVNKVKRGAATVSMVGAGQAYPGGAENRPWYELLGTNPEHWRNAWNATADPETGVTLAQSAASVFGVGAAPAGSDPSRLSRRERDEYFVEDTVGKVFTGTVDAFMYLADPLALAAGGAATAARARKLVKPDDVAAVFGSADEVGGLSRRAGRQRKIVDDLIEQTEGKTVSELSAMTMFRNSADPGTLAYWFGKANEVEDVATRHALKRDILAAGFGDPGAINRIREKSAALANDVDRMTSEIDDMLMAKQFTTPGGLDFAPALDKAYDSAAVGELTRSRDLIEEQIIQGRRLVGDEATGVVGLAGSLREQPLSAGYKKLQMARVTSVIHDGHAGSRAVHVITGRRLPGVINTSKSDAVDVFADALGRGREFLPDARRRQLLDEFVVADPKRRTAIILRAEEEIWAKIGEKHRLEPEQIAALLATARSRKAAYLNRLQKSRAYGSVTDGSSAVGLVDEDGVVMAIDNQTVKNTFGDAPMLSSQLTDTVTFGDPKELDRLLTRYSTSSGGLDGFLRKARKGGEDVYELTEAALTTFNRLWKFSALFRIAYPIRIQVDTQLRVIAALGAFQYARNAVGGGANFYDSLRRYGLRPSAQATRRVKTRRLGQSRLSPQEQEEFTALNTRLNSGLLAPDETAKLRKRHDELARKGKLEIVERNGQLIDATPYRSPEERARLFEEIDPGGAMLRLLDDGHTANLRELRASGLWDRVTPDRPEWADSYLRVVNKQFRNDPVAMRMLAGAGDDEILRWLNSTPDGRKAWRDLRDFYGAPEHLVARVRQNVEELVPRGTPLRASAVTRALTTDDIEKVWKLPADRPAVRGELLQEGGLHSHPVAQRYKQLSDWWFREVSTMPELVLGRHPLYVSRFRAHFQERLNNLPEGRLAPQMINEARQQASKLAKRDMTNTLYDISRHSNAAHLFRFVSPFFSAWEDTMTKWAGILGANPALIPRAYQLWGAPNNAGMVFDENGNRILKNGNIVDDDGKVIGKKGLFGQGQYIYVPAGKWMREKFGADRFRVSKTSFNIVFQGDPFWLPGPGPLAAIPVNALLTGAIPEIFPNDEVIKNWGPAQAEEAWAKWVMPYGPEKGGATAVATPRWINRLWQLVEGTDAEDYSRTYIQFQQETYTRIQNGELPQMSDREMHEYVNNMTRNNHILQFATAFASPVSVSPQSPLQFYIDEWHRLQREHGAAADDVFRQEYPEYYAMAINLTKNNTGINATVPAWEAATEYRHLIKKQEEYGWAVVGGANVGGEFSDGVYEAMFTQDIAPGSNKTWRESQDPAEVLNREQVEQGWADYRAAMIKLDTALEDRGLSSYSQKDAADIKALRDQFITGLKESNPAWAQEYLSGGGGDKIAKFVNWVDTEVSKYPELRNRSDFQTLDSYLADREVMVNWLRTNRKYTSLDHPTNADVKAVWEAHVSQYVRSDVGFEQMYYRVFQNDNLTSLRPAEGATDDG